jgi:hypothetical protein
MAQLYDNLTLESYKKTMNIVRIAFIMTIQHQQNFTYKLSYFKKLMIEFLNVFKYVNHCDFMDIQQDIEKNIEFLYNSCQFKQEIILEMINLNERTKEIAEDTIVLIDLFKETSRVLWKKKMEVFQKTKLNDDVLGVISSFSTIIR